MPTNKAQSILYEPFSMFHPDGTFMFHCNEKKVKWYVKRGLAEELNPQQFKFLFEPNGHAKSNDPYYMQAIENKCVVCGSLHDLNKHHVVPYVFRSRLPVEYKESNHHDILATCVDCHEAYEGYATDYKKELAEKSGVSINGAMTTEQKQNRKIMSARSFLKRLDSDLLKDSDGKRVDPAAIPAANIKILRNAASQELKDFDAHPGAVWADKIMNDVFKEDRLEEFMQLWRQHFLDYAKPQHLPQHWAVDHPLEVLGKSN